MLLTRYLNKKAILAKLAGNMQRDGNKTVYLGDFILWGDDNSMERSIIWLIDSSI